MSALDVTVTAAVVVAIALIVAAAPHFVRGFREARARRGIDLNMEYRAERELTEERVSEEEWRRRIDTELEDRVDGWRRDDAD